MSFRADESAEPPEEDERVLGGVVGEHRVVARGRAGRRGTRGPVDQFGPRPVGERPGVLEQVADVGLSRKVADPAEQNDRVVRGIVDHRSAGSIGRIRGALGRRDIRPSRRDRREGRRGARRRLRRGGTPPRQPEQAEGRVRRSRLDHGARRLDPGTAVGRRGGRACGRERGSMQRNGRRGLRGQWQVGNEQDDDQGPDDPCCGQGPPQEPSPGQGPGPPKSVGPCPRTAPLRNHLAASAACDPTIPFGKDLWVEIWGAMRRGRVGPFHDPRPRNFVSSGRPSLTLPKRSTVGWRRAIGSGPGRATSARPTGRRCRGSKRGTPGPLGAPSSDPARPSGSR